VGRSGSGSGGAALASALDTERMLDAIHFREKSVSESVIL
jgi:hypothetical protein